MRTVRLDSGVGCNDVGMVSTSTARGHEAVPLIGGVPLYNTNQDLQDSIAYKNGGDGDVGLTEAF